jgi:hypothetical protein
MRGRVIRQAGGEVREGARLCWPRPTLCVVSGCKRVGGDKEHVNVRMRDCRVCVWECMVVRKYGHGRPLSSMPRPACGLVYVYQIVRNSSSTAARNQDHDTCRPPRTVPSRAPIARCTLLSVPAAHGRGSEGPPSDTPSHLARGHTVRRSLPRLSLCAALACPGLFSRRCTDCPEPHCHSCCSPSPRRASEKSLPARTRRLSSTAPTPAIAPRRGSSQLAPPAGPPVPTLA